MSVVFIHRQRQRSGRNGERWDDERLRNVIAMRRRAARRWGSSQWLDLRKG
jgi:hypothetical protein